MAIGFTTGPIFGPSAVNSSRIDVSASRTTTTGGSVPKQQKSIVASLITSFTTFVDAAKTIIDTATRSYNVYVRDTSSPTGRTKVNTTPVTTTAAGNGSRDVVLPYTDVTSKTYAQVVNQSNPIFVVEVHGSGAEGTASDDFIAETQPLCPSCHSVISDSPLENRKQGQDEPGELLNGYLSSTSGAVPQWTDDPILTRPEGFNGTAYAGDDRVRGIHIIELQNARRGEEIEMGFSGSDLTDFFDVTEDTHVRAPHIIQLRESTEKILDALGMTLSDYFKLDAQGVERSPGPHDTAKDEWTDVERGKKYIHKDGSESGTFNLPSGTEADSPTLPANTRIRGVHIEDLRHPLLLGIPAVLISQPIIEITPFSEDRGLVIIEASKTGKARFEKAKPCELGEE